MKHIERFRQIFENSSIDKETIEEFFLYLTDEDCKVTVTDGFVNKGDDRYPGFHFFTNRSLLSERACYGKNIYIELPKISDISCHANVADEDQEKTFGSKWSNNGMNGTYLSKKGMDLFYKILNELKSCLAHLRDYDYAVIFGEMKINIILADRSISKEHQSQSNDLRKAYKLMYDELENIFGHHPYISDRNLRYLEPMTSGNHTELSIWGKDSTKKVSSLFMKVMHSLHSANTDNLKEYGEDKKLLTLRKKVEKLGYKIEITFHPNSSFDKMRCEIKLVSDEK